MNTILTLWTGEIEKYTPSEPEKLNLPLQVPPFAIGGRWYQVTLLKRDDEGVWIENEPETFKKVQERVFENEGYLFRIRKDRVLIGDGDEKASPISHPEDKKTIYTYCSPRGYNILVEYDEEKQLLQRTRFKYHYLQEGEEDWSYKDGEKVIKWKNDALFVNDMKTQEEGKHYPYVDSDGLKVFYAFYERKCMKYHHYQEKEAFLNQDTGDLYRKMDSIDRIRLKTLGGLFLIPFYIIGVIVANILKGLVDIIYLPILALAGSKSFKEIPLEYVKNIWNIFRPIIYGIGMEIGSIYALYDPLEGLARIGKMEADLKDPHTRKDDIRYMWLHKESLGSTLFCYLCFQKIGNLYKDKVGDKFKFYIYKTSSIVNKDA